MTVSRRAFLGGLLSCSAFVLAGCGGSSAPTPGSTNSSSAGGAAGNSSPSGSAAPSSAASTSAQPSASVAASPASSGGAASAGPIKIGVILPLTGPQSPVGKDNQDALNLYLSSVHSTLAGRTIDPLVQDGQFQADVSLTKAKELVENQKAAALMGFTDTPSGYAVATYVKQSAHVPMLITDNSGGEGMLTDPKYNSPYLTRWTQTGAEVDDPAADWAIKQGYRQAATMVSDFAAGVQNVDLFASAFIRKGGSIVQEQYSPLGTADFGPYLAKLNKSADVIFVFLPGVDGLRFAQQYPTYVGQSKAQIIDSFGVITAGSNLAQLKDQAAGIVGVDVFNQGSDDPGTQAFVKAWQAAYPGRILSHDCAEGYLSGQIFAAALEKVNGHVENTTEFLQALYGLNLDTAKGPVHLDQNHDVVQNIYVYRIEKNGSSVAPKVLQTYTNVSDTWDRSAQELSTFPWNNFKGKWAGMTQAQLSQALK